MPNKIPTTEPSLYLEDINLKASQIAKLLRGGEILALIGGLGSGKTAFAKALAKCLKVKKTVTSPTFVIMNIFRGQLPSTGKNISLLHLDLYRTAGLKDIKSLGLMELWQQPNVITVIEWADKIKKHLPQNAKILRFYGSNK